MDLAQRVIENWTEEAVSYSENVREELESDTPAKWIRVINSYIPVDRTLDFLDIGTGPGFFPVILSREGHRVTGIDCTRAMLDQAIENAGRYNISADFILAEGDDLPFDDSTFDCVISRNVAWTLADPVRSYKEWLRVLRPGGRLIIFDANWNHRYYDDELMKKHLEDLENYASIFEKNSGVAHDLSERGETFRRDMPMSRVSRPRWDLNFFSVQDVSRIICDLRVYETVWNEKRKTAYASTPMFLIVIEK